MTLDIRPTGLVTPRFPSPPPKYDRENEAQYRQATERLLRQLVAQSVASGQGTVINSLVFDPDNTLDVGYYVDGTGTSDKRPAHVYAGTHMRAPRFLSDVVTGTSPLTVASTTKVANLNADLLDDQTGSYYVDPFNMTGFGAAGGYLRSSGAAWARVSGIAAADVTAGTFGTGAYVSDTSFSAPRLISTVAIGTAPLTVTSTTVVANLHATNSDQLGGSVAALYAFLASPTFTGTPLAPTAAPGTNTTQLATTAFVTAAGSALTVPLSQVTAGTSPAGTFIFPTLAGTVRVTSALMGTTTNTDVILDRNSLTVLTLGASIVTANVEQLLVGPNTGAFGLIDVNGATGTQRSFRFKTAGVLRWEIRAAENAESGGDSGSDYRQFAYTDAGVFIDTVWQVLRVAGGLSSFNRPTNFTSRVRIGSAAVPSASSMLEVAGNAVTTGTIQRGLVFSSAFDVSAATGSARASELTWVSRAIAGTTAEGAAIVIGVPSIGAGSVATSGYGILIQAQTWTGSTTAIGLDIRAVTGAVTNNFALRTSTGDVRFGDKVLAVTDNAYDFGAAGATRFRTGYFGTSLVVGADPGGSNALRIGGASFLAGNVTYATDNTYDEGASGAARPRAVFAGSAVVMGRTLSSTLTLADGDCMIVAGYHKVTSAGMLVCSGDSLVQVV